MQSRRSDAAGTRAAVLACVFAAFLGGAGEARSQDAGDQTYDCVVKPSLIVKLGTPVSGLLSEVLVDRGLIVERGDVKMIADVTFQEPIGGTYRASVEIVDLVLDAASGTFGVRLALPNPDFILPAGIRCEARLPLGETSRSDADQAPVPPRAGKA